MTIATVNAFSLFVVVTVAIAIAAETGEVSNSRFELGG
jgi:hypothetical protein